MKIKKITFLKYKHFKENHEVIFEENGKIPDITFLVGDNGSGKTAVLDAIYALHEIRSIEEDYKIDYSVQITDEEMKTAGILSNEITVHIVKSITHVEKYGIDSKGTRLNESVLNSIKKVIFSCIETNFTETTFDKVTAKSIDGQALPNEKSINLSAEIPQLLIDIKNADSNEWMDYCSKNESASLKDKPVNIASRLNRFIKIFHLMYDGSKKFKEIRDKDNNKHIIFTDTEGREVSLNQLSTGEKQIIYRIGYLLKNLGTIAGGIVLIDEPEISLHPIWQARVKNIIKKTFKGLNIQLIMATHSPYIFQEFQPKDESCIKIVSSSAMSKSIALGTKKIELQKSTNYISYIAYGVVSVALHIELYTLLQIQEKKDSITKMEKWLNDKKGGNVKFFKKFIRTRKYYQEKVGTSVTETLPTYIRNALHHGDEVGRIYTTNDLKKSINILLKLLK